MLALKAVLARADRVPTMIFDEVDAGIGGRVAAVVAQKLAAAADGRQVLCVTHLATDRRPRRATTCESAKSVRGGSDARQRGDRSTGDGARARRSPAWWRAIGVTRDGPGPRRASFWAAGLANPPCIMRTA